ncbi:MAG: biosynthetic-type acetolactate synthase large subunit [Lachnospiraceae bacterium]|nr:biosynthetic-type acetolactate synthase large subunit [Lachnospiraceae bacterium]
MKLSGSEIVVQCLKEQGVDTVFGYPGGAILNVYDALYKHSDEITHILTSHEQGASHAADGYARATGKVGVCFATSGPGATNLVTGISTAYMDSVPMVAITCNVTNNLLGKDSFQEVDINGICMPITKYSSIVKDVNRLADTIRRAFQIARSGRPGPVLVDITKDVTAAIADYEPCTPERFMARTKTYKKADIREAVEMIRASRKPFVLIGGGAIISEASDVIRRFIDKIDAPFSETLMAQGAVDQHDPRYTGMPGMHGTKTSNLAIGRCDLLIALGTRFSDRVYGNATSFAYRAKILQIDVDAAEINKNIKVDHAIIGDLREVLDKINDQLDGVKHAEWLQEIRGLKEKYPLNYDHSVLTGPMVIEALDRLTDGRAIITTDVGQHQMWAAQYYTYSSPRTFISSGGAGTMGYGLGAAIGAKTACPDRTVINIAGDGCFRMNMNELATASRYNIPVIEIVLDNHVLGMVRQWQTLFYGARYSATVLHDKVDFCKVAEGLGCKALRIESPDQVEPVLKEALACEGPVMVDVIIDDDDKVFPMVSPGASIEDAFDARDMEQSSK